MDDSPPLEDAILDTVEYALINLVRHYPELYNPQDSGNRDRGRREAAWADIARQLNKEDGWCYMKWRNLSDYYKKRKKIYENGGTAGTASASMKRWVYYDAMSFLDHYENSRPEFSNNLVNIPELSSGSSRSASDQIDNPEEVNHHPNYFDETQYHSLDGISERAAAEVKMHHVFDYTPPPKKQKTSNSIPAERERETFGNEPTAGPSGSTSLFPSRLHHNAHTFHVNGVNDACTSFGTTPTIVSIHSKAKTSSSSSQCENTSDKGKINATSNTSKTNDAIDNNPAIKKRNESPITNDGCPHYHFCMSLLARFRNMEPSTAIYMQMKIMELLLKTEYPSEYKRKKQSMD